MKTTSLSLTLLIAVSVHAADDPVLFRAAFDGSTAATLRGQPLAPAKAEKAVFAEGALVTGAGTSLEYDLGEGLPGATGSLEIRFRPGFPQRPEGERRVAFSLAGADGAHLDFEFEPMGTCWRFATQFPDWRRQLSAPYFTAVVAEMRAAYGAWWAEAVPMMVNENVPNSPVRPFWELYDRQLANDGIPEWPAPRL